MVWLGDGPQARLGTNCGGSKAFLTVSSCIDLQQHDLASTPESALAYFQPHCQSTDAAPTSAQTWGDNRRGLYGLR